MTDTLTSTSTSTPPQRARTSWRQDLVATALATWLMVGTVLDGRIHKLGKVESFFTWWHLVLYTGFLALSAWLLVVAGPRSRRRGGVPAGYGLALLGSAGFLLSGVADLAWHLAFGIESGLAAGFSPPHILLMVSGILLITGPLRAAWSGAAEVRPGPPGLAGFLPVVVTASLVCSSVFFFIAGVAALETPLPWGSAVRPFRAVSQLNDFINITLLGKVLITNVVLLGFTLLLLRRWRLPFGALTVLYGVVGLMTATEDNFRVTGPLLAVVVAGLAGDVLVRAVVPAPQRRGRLWLFATAMPVVLWSVYFASVAATSGLDWQRELLGGAIVFAALTGLGLAMLVAPPGAAPGPADPLSPAR